MGEVIRLPRQIIFSPYRRVYEQKPLHRLLVDVASMLSDRAEGKDLDPEAGYWLFQALANKAITAETIEMAKKYQEYYKHLLDRAEQDDARQIAIDRGLIENESDE